MTTLVLGVAEVAYDRPGEAPAARITKKGRVHKADAMRIEREMSGHDRNGGPATTVSVANALEERYGVMAAFYARHEDDVTAALVESVEGALEDVYAGSPVSDPFAQAGQAIAAEFRKFLMTAEIETMGIDGVPTKASLERKSARFKAGVSEEPRPSFIDTATYELAFRAWTE